MDKINLVKCRAPKKGDIIYVFAPANTMFPVDNRMIKIGISKLEELGFSIKIAPNVKASGPLGIATVKERLDDIYEGLTDPEVSIMMPVFGGYNSNQLLNYLDFEIIRENPKLWIGYSDITALLNAFYGKIGISGLCSMGFVSFCDPNIAKKAINVFLNYLDKNKTINYTWPNKRAEDLWFLKQDYGPREWQNCSRVFSINDGFTEGVTIGGNFDTLMALAGTPYFPSLKGKLLFLESALDESPTKFLRLFTQLTQQSDFKLIKGIVFSKFSMNNTLQKDPNLFKKLILSEVNGALNVPILANAPFSHIDPIFAFPIGCNAKLKTGKSNTLKINTKNLYET